MPRNGSWKVYEQPSMPTGLTPCQLVAKIKSVAKKLGWQVTPLKPTKTCKSRLKITITIKEKNAKRKRN